MAQLTSTVAPFEKCQPSKDGHLLENIPNPRELVQEFRSYGVSNVYLQNKVAQENNISSTNNSIYIFPKYSSSLKTNLVFIPTTFQNYTIHSRNKSLIFIICLEKKIIIGASVIRFHAKVFAIFA
jgi:hypothetical protein